MIDTKSRTIDKARWDAGQEAWSRWEADASERMRDEWIPWRALATEAARIVDPPDHGPESGRWDEWTAEHPTQLAILTRAIRETPGLLEQAIRSEGVWTWGDVIERFLPLRDQLRDALFEADRAEQEAWERTKADESEAAPAVLERIGWRG